MKITTIVARPRAGSSIADSEPGAPSSGRFQRSRIKRVLNLPAGLGGVISRFHYAHRSHEDAAYSGESRVGPLLRAIKLWSDRGHDLADPDPTAGLRRAKRVGCVSFIAAARLRRSRGPRARVRGT